MASIYIHIPFCKQACHYCDFHFSTSLQKKDDLIQALITELTMRKTELSDIIECIYFGGGTPSLLRTDELQHIITHIHQHYTVSKEPEITLEANPDDLSKPYIKSLSQTQINRLSIGVQSFFETDLKLMNRAHTASEALECITYAKSYFNNISIDLIYGIPGLTTRQWQQNLEIALNLNVPHISSYALTVEPNTALQTFIEKGTIKPLNDALAKTHFETLLHTLHKAKYINYEFSNFGKPGFMSRNNTAYWTGKPYIGIGPSAHSFNGNQRSWNINNNTKYIKSIAQNKRPSTLENLSKTDRYNEYVMTGLRTMWGVSLLKIETDFGKDYKTYILKQAENYISKQLLSYKDNSLTVTNEGKFLSDGIASHLFMIA